MIDFSTQDIHIPLGSDRRIVGEWVAFSVKWRLQKKVFGVLFSHWVTQNTVYEVTGDKTSDVLQSLVGKEDYEKFITPYLIKK